MVRPYRVYLIEKKLKAWEELKGFKTVTLHIDNIFLKVLYKFTK